MARFRFRAVTGTGEVVEGEIEAQSQAAVVEQLRGQGHLPLAAEPVGAGAGGSTLQRWLRQPLFGAGRVRRREVAIMTRELATLLDAGLTVDQSLRLLVDLADERGDAPPARRSAAAGPGRQHARRCARPARGRVLPRLCQHGARRRGRRQL